MIKFKVFRIISTDQLNILLCLHIRPINVIVYDDSYHPCGWGRLILKEASRLYAFSVYPFDT